LSTRAVPVFDCSDMSNRHPEDTEASRLEAALEMWDDGVQIMRANLRRSEPDASDEQIDAALDRWLTTRPGAEHGDSDGVRVVWPRPSK